MAVHRVSFIWLLLISLGVLVLDQLSKRAVEKYTEPGSLKVVIPGLLNLEHTRNTGVAFGMFADASSPWVAVVLVAFSLAVIAFLVWLLASGRAGGTLSQIGMALILGGACGNLLDRIVRHSVTDFIDFYISSHHWYTFNVADSAIVVGAGLVLLELFRDLQHPTGKKV